MLRMGGVHYLVPDLKMFHSWIRALLLATCCLGIVTAEYNAEICQMIKESYGLVPPPIPTNFESKAEHIDHVKNYTMYEEMHFDHTNQRAKYMYLLNGIEHHFLFDYEVQQIVQYDILHPGIDIKRDPLSHTCVAVPMDEAEEVDIFGYIEGDSGSLPKMFDSNQVLRFGGRYIFAFNGSERMSDRGLLIDKFIGCVYDDSLDATINATFSFSSKRNLGVGTSGGTKEEEVTGIENGLLSVPVKAQLYGSLTNYKNDNPVFFNKTLNYFWFKGEPQFEHGTFSIPPYLYCNDYRGRKNMTKFPTAFSTRIQRTKLEVDIFGKLGTSEVTEFESISYYKEKNLASREYTPGPQDSEIKSKFQNLQPVRTIYDFNQGLLYTSNIASGRCFIRPIEHGDFFETSANILYISIGSPEEIFQMEANEMKYKGQDFTRDIECDVWAGKYKDDKFNATYTKETYISTNGWHEEADDLAEYGVPVKHTIIQNELNGEMMEGITSYSFLKFMAKPPPLIDFDVSNCIETQGHRDFALILTISEATKKLLFDYKYQFLETAQYYTAEVTQMMSPLRVQRVEYRLLSNSNPLPVLLVTLVDKIKLNTKVPVGQRGANLDQAAVNLQIIVDTNQFAIKFYAPGSTEMTLVPALRGSLYVKKSSGELTYYAPVSDIDDQEEIEIMHDNPVEEDEYSKGMTPSHLTLLCFAMLFIGIGIGICMMYLYLRRQSESMMEDRITLSLQKSVEVPTNSTIAEMTQ